MEPGKRQVRPPIGAGRLLILKRWLLLAVAGTGLLGAQTLRECRTIYLQPMPESLDEFISVEMLKWGAMKVVTSDEKADCIARFGQNSTRTEIKSSGSEMLPANASVRQEYVPRRLPEAHGVLGEHREAALMLIDQRTGGILWADAKTDSFAFNGGPRTLARRLVEQLKKDWGKKR